MTSHQSKIAAFLSVLISVSGSSCFGKRDDAGLGSGGSSDPGIVTADPGVTRTLSIVTFDQVLDSMSALTGVTPSVSTSTYLTVNRSSFALQGRTKEITAGMWMAISTLAGHVCRDLYDQERARDAGSRIYYRSLNLSNTASNTRADLNLARDRLALGIWGREAYSDETSFFDAAIVESGVTEPYDANETRNVLLILCSGTLASLAAVAR